MSKETKLLTGTKKALSLLFAGALLLAVPSVRLMAEESIGDTGEYAFDETEVVLVEDALEAETEAAAEEGMENVSSGIAIVSVEEVETAEDAGISVASIESSSASTTSTVESGTCGDNLTWVIDDSGTLTISGTGAMDDFTFSPWLSYTDVTKVVIEYGCTYIGKDAFLRCTHITSISIPESVASIGYYAFGGCDALTSLVIPESVTNIDAWCFANSDNLVSVTLPSGLTEIKEYTFSGCKKLANITIPSGVTSIGNNAFASCESLASINIPSGVTVIEHGTFSGCDGFTSFTIPDNITTIGDNAFFGCENLVSITIPDNVTSIGESAFAHCFALTSFSFPSGITTIETEMFSYDSALKTVSIPKSVKEIKENAFSGCSGLKTVNYAGSKTQWNAITIGAKNSYLTSASISYGTSPSTLDKCSIKTLKNKTSGIQVKWNIVSGASGYYVYRKSGSGSYKKVKTFKSGTKSSWTDTSVRNNVGTKYTYKVVAYADGEKSEASTKSIVRLKSTSISSTKASTKKIVIKWKKSSSVTGYQIQYATDDSFDDAKTKKISGSSSTSGTVSGLNKETRYYIRIRTYKKVSGKNYYSAWSSTKTVKTK